MKFNKHRTTLTSLLVFCIMYVLNKLLQDRNVCSNMLSWINRYYNYELTILNHWWCLNGNDTRKTLWIEGSLPNDTLHKLICQDTSSRWIDDLQYNYSKRNGYVSSSQIRMIHLLKCNTSFNCTTLLDYVLEWNITKINIKQKLAASTDDISPALLFTSNTSRLSINLSTTKDQPVICQSSIRTGDKITLETNSYLVLQLYPNTTNSTYDVHLYPPAEFTTNGVPICYCELRCLFHPTKHRINCLFAYIIIITMVFVSVMIIITNILKHRFNIHIVRKKQRVKYSKEYRHRIIQHLIYMNICKLETIPEEYGF